MTSSGRVSRWLHTVTSHWKDTVQVGALFVGGLWVLSDLVLGKSMPSADVEIKDVDVFTTAERSVITCDVQLSIHSGAWMIRRAALSIAPANTSGPLEYPDGDDGCQHQLAQLQTFSALPQGDTYRVSCLATAPVVGCQRIQVRIEGSRTFALMPSWIERRWWGSETRAQRIVCPDLESLRDNERSKK